MLQSVTARMMREVVVLNFFSGDPAPETIEDTFQISPNVLYEAVVQYLSKMDVTTVELAPETPKQ